ncbi:Cyn operon transcriptional activator [Legionella massiliensis]|uniref:Cyn operon transcriptional activator n=1 Tax=Legionella massiliensis TaxID=1034943 RepID=A0A078KXM7_9GAMM|nr:LysR family transcriptional regulator [Legionella massiliensis]CDZ77782.1 Cyn operon transcriptional activator [Legionella massiliensis]CEE13520.1 HTH-type transcriptional regulator CynR [Legionella massiliensis]
MLPSAAELEYFLEVSNTLNLSRASERLGVSQPSLSLAIKRLEQSLGAQIFVRHKHGVTLTQAGQQLLLQARLLLQHWENTKSKALASHQKVQGYITVGCHPTIAIYLVSKFLADLLENYPKLEIHLKHDISRKITEQVINLSIHIGIVVNPFKHPDLVIRKICEDEVTFWVAEGARKIQDIHSKDAVILCEPDLTQTQNLLQKIKKTGTAPKRIMTMNSLEVVANLTANGCGIGILPTRVAKSMYPDKLRRIPNAPVYSDEVCLIYRNENRNIQAIQTISNVIKALF